MAKKKQLKVYASLVEENSVGWPRDDVPDGLFIHVFGQAKPGAPFRPSDGNGGPHWPCAVCDAHGFTREDFDVQMRVLMKGL